MPANNVKQDGSCASLVIVVDNGNEEEGDSVKEEKQEARRGKKGRKMKGALFFSKGQEYFMTYNSCQ
eukprot:12267757-Ditylum_brightwellii.AAC.1